MVRYRWNIFWAALDPVIGSEQAGMRPVLVISAEEANEHLPLLAIVPLTTAEPGRRRYSTSVFLAKEETGLPRDSLALAHQIRTISKKKIGGKCGELQSTELQYSLWHAVKKYLGQI